MVRRFFYAVLLLMALSWTACKNQENKENKEADYKIELITDDPFTDRAGNRADTLRFRLKIVDAVGNKTSIFGTDAEITFEESGEHVKRTISTSLNSKKGFNPKTQFWFMVDRSQSTFQNDLDILKDDIKKIVNRLPQCSVYISFFDSEVSENRQITSANFGDFDNAFTRQPDKHKLLFSAIPQKFHDFENAIENDSTVPHYLFVFTDGNLGKGTNLTTELKTLEQIPDTLDRKKNNICMFAFYYTNTTTANTEPALKALCINKRPHKNVKGKVRPADNIEAIYDDVINVIDENAYDYELVWIRKMENFYNGEEKLTVTIKKEDKIASGDISYSIGSLTKPVGIESRDIVLSLFLGLLFIFLGYFIIQVVIPYFKYKFINFEKRYVEPMKYNEGEEELTCPYDMEPIKEGDLVVKKCKNRMHWMHWDCWQENGHRCVEYPTNCKDGIQFFFDKKNPFDLKASPFYLKWAMAGMAGGFLLYCVYLLIGFRQPFLASFTDSVVHHFFKTENIGSIIKFYKDKNSSWLLTGILLGFVLTFLFGYINEYAPKKGKVLLLLFGRAALGAVVGFLSFFVVAIVCMALGKTRDTFYLDAIPWLLFSISIALCLTIKTTLNKTNAFWGGLISGAVSFLILLAMKPLGLTGIALSFMLCSAGIGIAITIKDYFSEQHILHCTHGSYNMRIPLHKWLNEQETSKVDIGKSNHCIISMSWDKSPLVHDKQAQIYQKGGKLWIAILENDMIYNGNKVEKNVYPLTDGMKFKIGDSEFQYEEK